MVRRLEILRDWLAVMVVSGAESEQERRRGRSQTARSHESREQLRLALRAHGSWRAQQVEAGECSWQQTDGRSSADSPLRQTP